MKEQIRQLGITDDGAEMFMMNLNTYKGGAGEDPTANEDYQTYGRGTLPLLTHLRGHDSRLGSECRAGARCVA